MEILDSSSDVYSTLQVGGIDILALYDLWGGRNNLGGISNITLDKILNTYINNPICHVQSISHL